MSEEALNKPLCRCDPTFEPFSGCDETACLCVNIIFAVAFSGAWLCVSFLIYHLFRANRNPLELIKIITYFNYAAMSMRVVRFGMLLSPTLNPTDNPQIISAFNAVYSFTPLFGMLAYTVMSYIWIYMYHEVIVKSEKGQIPSRKEVLRQPLFPIYFTLNTLAYLIWVVLFSVNLGGTNNNIPSIWLSAVILNSAIFLFIYGYRISRKMKMREKDIGGMRSSSATRFQKLKGTAFVSSAILVALVLFIGGTQVVPLVLLDYHTVYFIIARNVVIHSIEICLLTVISRAVEPQGFVDMWKPIMFWRKTSERQVGSNDTTRQMSGSGSGSKEAA